MPWLPGGKKIRVKSRDGIEESAVRLPIQVEAKADREEKRGKKKKARKKRIKRNGLGKSLPQARKDALETYPKGEVVSPSLG